MKKNPKLEKRRAEICKVNAPLKKHLRHLISQHIKVGCRKDAMDILMKADKETVMEFLFFAMSDKGNLACLCLDFAQDNNGKVINNKSFGNNYSCFGVELINELGEKL